MSDKSPLSAGDNPAYIDSLLTFLGDRDPLQVFAETPDAVRRAVQAAPESILRTPEAPGKWSILDVVQHLAQVEFVLGFRYRKVLAEETPAIPAIDQDKWVSQLFPESVGLEEALQDFAAVREVNLHLLRRLQDEHWDRYGIHSQRGNESMRQMARLYAAHDLYHLFQIERIQKAVQA